MYRLYYLTLVFVLLQSCSFTEAGKGTNVGPSRIALKSTTSLYQFLTYGDQRFPLVSAHRGGPEKAYPENALETFRHSASKQPIVIECDIALSKDSVLVLMHDDRLDRTTTGKGLVSRYTYKELQQFSLKDTEGRVTPYKIPTLDTVLSWGKEKVLFTLDIKKGVPMHLVLDAVIRNQASANCIIITYNANQAAEVHRSAPELMISASIRRIDDLIRLNDYGVPDNRLVAFVGVTQPDPTLYKQLHDHGILCILGTMGNLDRQASVRGNDLYYQLIETGADIISTDRPTEAGFQLAKYRKDHGLLLSEQIH